MSGKPFLQVVESAETFTAGVWRLNRNLVVNKTAVFPDRCIICNEPACGRYIRKTFVWHNPLLLPVIAISFPFYVLLAMFWRKILRLEVPVCPRHSVGIKFGTSLSIFLLPQVFILGLTGLLQGIPVLMLLGLFSSLCGFLLLIWIRNPVWASIIRSEYGMIRGAHPDFVDSFPAWDGEALDRSS